MEYILVGDVLHELKRPWPHHCFGGKNVDETTIPVPLLKRATEEIERLRASQFRWIPVGERLPAMEDCGNKIELVLCVLKGGSVGINDAKRISLSGYTHWAPIPPLPEQSQESRDEELWDKFRKGGPFTCDTEHGRIKEAFLYGLKAARSQQPQ